MRKIAIIGTAPGSRDMAPFADATWDIWVCSPGNGNHQPQPNPLKRITAWFELHSLPDMIGLENQPWSIPYFAWLKSSTFPVYMQERNELVPQCKIFPMPVLVERFGKNWFTSSVAWMVAYALHLGVDEIAIFGVDMASDHEMYSAQRSALVRWAEICEELGVKISIPWESCLGHHPPLYGYDEATPMGRRLSILKFMGNQQLAQLEMQKQRTDMEIAFAKGALAQLRYSMTTWLDGSNATQFLDLPDEIVKEAKDYALSVTGAKAGFVPHSADNRPLVAPNAPPREAQPMVAQPTVIDPSWAPPPSAALAPPPVDEVQIPVSRARRKSFVPATRKAINGAAREAQ